VEQDQQFDSSFLKELDKAIKDGLYPLVVTGSIFGMRGIDYRSRNVAMHLIIARSFDTERDALQGLNRVGRFGDSCTRTMFANVELIDKRASLINRGKIQKFLAAADTQKVQVKATKIKELMIKAPKNTGAKNKGREMQLLWKPTEADLKLGQPQ
jgi:hypothetical protein